MPPPRRRMYTSLFRWRLSVRPTRSPPCLFATPGTSPDPARSALDCHDDDRHGRRVLDPRVQRRLHEGRSGLPPVLRLPEPVHLLHAGARDGRERVHMGNVG